MRYEDVKTHTALLAAAIVACAVVTSTCSKPAPAPAAAPPSRTYGAPEEAVHALTQAVGKGDLREVVAIFGPEGRELVDSSDAVAARRNRETFTAAIAEGWRLIDERGGKTLVVGNEGWPFPVPIVKDANGWRFDTASGKEEVLARRIGRNELAAIQICRTYVVAQRSYARQGHDGKPAGLYARTFRSAAGRHDGLYWPVAHGQPRSPLGDLMPEAAAEEGSPAARRAEPAPFHGYYFRILEAQGPSAGEAKSYVVNGDMSGGFALVAWPAQYNVTGVMTFVVNHDGVVHEKDMGAGTEAAAKSMTLYEPDASWAAVE